MSSNKNETTVQADFPVEGLLSEEGVGIPKKQAADRLASSGYGVDRDGKYLLTFFEALYMTDKKVLQVKDRKGKEVDFRRLLKCYEAIDENAWAKYLAYRDLRSRGYVAREGFGAGIDFRVYERGEYNKDTAKYLVLSIQEGKPISLESLTATLKQSQSLKKELILAVMNRRGEIVYYSVSQLTLK